ncbi:signal peptidase I [Streptomyces fradiae]|uniref:signal peptidase I n=1 Tax=Streptomyces fradiae TaxID=1906 RepID=UPI002942120B|nr:signal peptidase I [Streptomyces fradiae]WOI62223.1 signal peptidase I [Streptomyces fradiae]
MDTEATHPERDLPPDAERRPERGSRFALSRRTAALIGIAWAAVLLLLGHFVVQPFQIPSRSMEPTLQVGDRVIVNKLAYRFGDRPERGDVVVFDGTGSFVRTPAEENPVAGLVRGAARALGLAEPDGNDFVKRVVGVGGDRVKCCDKAGRIEVNGAPVEERYLYPGDTPSSVRFDIAVPRGTLWVMGDHRSQSSDSRDHLGSPGGGVVPVDMVVGRADWIGWPARRWSAVEPTGAFGAVPDPPAPGSAGPGGGRG